MSIRSQEDALFKKWRRHHGVDFVADGVVSEQHYGASKPKVLFLLKEPNDPGPCRCDLRTYLLDGARQPSWTNVARWTEGIQKLDVDIPWSELSNDAMTDARRQKALRSIVAVNIKKTPGGFTSDHKELKRVAVQDARFLEEQLTLYTPDLIVCCGQVVTDYLKRTIGWASGLSWHTTTRGVDYAALGSGRHIIAFSHPEARVADNLLHYGLVDAVREIRGVPVKR